MRKLIKKVLSALVAVALVGLPLTMNAASAKARLENCGSVMEEILNVPFSAGFLGH